MKAISPPAKSEATSRAPASRDNPATHVSRRAPARHGAEARHLDLSMEERTKLSGQREVSLKTTFPDIFSLVLNRFTLYPFYLLQKWSLQSKRALMLYFEAKPDA